MMRRVLLASFRSTNPVILNRQLFNLKHAALYPGFAFTRSFASYPNHIKITLPALSPTMDKGNITSWVKKEGDKIKEGDTLAEIETDKAVMTMDTIEEGYLAKIVLPAGTKEIPVGKLLCILVANQGDIGAFKDFKDDSPPIAAAAPPTAPAPAAPAAPPPTPTPAEAPPAAVPQPTMSPEPTTMPQSPATDTGGRVYASPFAKKLAQAQSLRLQGKGSGVHQSIKSTDLAGMSAAGAKAAVGAKSVSRGPNKYKDIPVSSVRGVIAKRLLESKTTIPHFYVTVECNMTNVMRMREKVNKQYKKAGIRISINDIMIKAMACACLKVPETNSYWMKTFIRQYEHVDVSVAVSTDGGLITPIIFSADEKGIIEISQDMKSLAKKARANKLKPAEFQGGTVCISNMGMFGIDNFCAIINPPQSLILAVSATKKKLVADKSAKGFREIHSMMVTASADHRIVDGVVCATWLNYLRDFIEEPGTMLL